MSTGIKSRYPARTVPNVRPLKSDWFSVRSMTALCRQLIQSLPQRRLRRQGLDPERMCENRVFGVEARICEVGAGVAEHTR